MTVSQGLFLVWIALVPMSCMRASSPSEPQGAAAARVAAMIEAGDYIAAEDLARALVDDVRRANSERSLEMAAARDLLVQALVANGKGSSDEARALATRALQAKEAQRGADHLDLVPSLQNLARVAGDERHDEEAVRTAKHALSIQERAGTSGIALARTLDLLGRALTRAGQYNEAVTILERSLGITEHAPDQRERARSLEALAGALQDKGDYQAAGEPLSRALALRRPRDVGHPEYIETLSLLSYQEWSRGRFGAARDAASAALGIAERTLRPDHPARARAVRLLGVSKLDLWEIEAARDLMQQALGMAERGLGPTHPDIVAYLNDLASPTLRMGDFQSARTLYDRSLGIREAQFGNVHESVATAVYNLAFLDASLGDYERAQVEYQRAMEIWERVYSPDHAFVAQAAGELGVLARQQGRPREALPLLERALRIRERSHGDQHRLVALTLNELAETYRQLGRSAEAWRDTQRSLRIWAVAGSPDDHEYAAALALSAELSAADGDLRAAGRAYGQAVAIDRRLFGPTHPASAQLSIGLARVQARSGARADAMDAARNAESIGREHLRLMLRSLPERQALSYATVRPRGLDLMLSLVGVESRAAAAALEALVRSRALVLDEVAARRRDVATAPDAATGELVAALSAAQQRVASLVVRGAGAIPPAQYADLLEAARNSSETAERRLAEASAAFRAERSRAEAGLDKVAASMPADSAVVSFVRYQQLRLSGRSRATPPNRRGPPADETPSYLAFVLRAGRKPEAVKLGAAQAIDGLVSKWRGDIAVEARTASGVPRVSSRGSGAALRAKVWDPLAPHLDGARQVFIVPDGTLGLVPFAALPVGRDSFILEQAPPIHYLSAERDVVSTSDGRTSRAGMLAIGGPAFDDVPASLTPSAAGHATETAALRSGAGACGSLQALRFESLAGTLQEAQEVSRLWPTSLGAARTLVGREAGERAFKQDAGGYRVLHLATHGFFLDGSCLPESAAANTRGVGGLSTTKPVENPLRLSGLALAGANRRELAGPDEDDGILTAEEVASLDLQGVEWAVLSACDTGVGEIKAGEGVFGLRRAFQVAGARTVVMSLWSVDDQATRAWMRALYEGRFQKKLSTADAVHQASLSVLRDRRARGLSTHPFYWAAFVAAGDWR